MVFFRKKEEKPAVGKGYIPTERAKELSERGFTESEIIDILRKEGFSPSEIEKALSWALKIGMEEKPAPTKPPESKKEEVKLPTAEELKPPEPEVPKVPEVSLPQEYYYSTADYIDYVVRERMKEVDTRVAEMVRRYEELARRMAEIDVTLRELTRSRPAEEKLIAGKLAEMSESMKDVGIRLGGLEKAFKETLPALIESVRALTELVEGLKGR